MRRKKDLWSQNGSLGADGERKNSDDGKTRKKPQMTR